MPAYDLRCSDGQIAAGVDIRADGGYVAWWPACGLATVGDLEDLTPWPEWLKPAPQPKLNGAHGTSLGKIGAGQRNDFLSREAYRLRKQGADGIATILRSIDAERCEPPVEDMELEAIVRGKERVEPEPTVSDAEPTPLIKPTPPPAPYPLDSLGPILAPAARAIADIVQVPDALAANSVLAAAALAAQSHADVQTLGGPRPLSLFVLTIAQSGERKTAADSVALCAVHEHGKRMVLRYNSALREWEAAQEGMKLEVRNARKEAESGAEFASTLKEMEPEPKPRAPWLICNEPTAEGLVRSLADGQLAQGIFTDEGGQFIGGHALSDEAELRTIAMLSRLWQGDRIDRVRATNHEHLVLFGRRL